MPSSWQPNAVQAPQCVTFLTIDAAMRKVRGERPVLVGDPTWDCVAARRAEILSGRRMKVLRRVDESVGHREATPTTYGSGLTTFCVLTDDMRA